MTGTCGQMTKMMMMMIKSDITHQDDTHMHAHFLSVVFVSHSRLVDVMNDLTDLFGDFYCLRPFFPERFQIHLTDDVLERVQSPHTHSSKSTRCLAQGHRGMFYSGAWCLCRSRSMTSDRFSAFTA